MKKLVFESLNEFVSGADEGNAQIRDIVRAGGTLEDIEAIETANEDYLIDTGYAILLASLKNNPQLLSDLLERYGEDFVGFDAMERGLYYAEKKGFEEVADILRDYLDYMKSV